VDTEKNTKKNKKTQEIPPKIEFYVNLYEIKDLYDKGYRVRKTIYDLLKEKYQWNMSYNSFLIYFKREFEQKEVQKNTPKEEVEQKEEPHQQTTDTPKKGLVWDEEMEQKMRDYQEMVKRQEEANQQRSNR